MNTATIEQLDTTQAVDIVRQAEALEVHDAAGYTQAGELLRTVKSFQAEIRDWFKPRKADADRVHKQYCADEQDRLRPLLRAEALLKDALRAWDEEQERLAKDEQRRLEEIARQREETRRLNEAAALEREANALSDPELLYEANELLVRPIETPLVSVAKATPKVDGIAYRETWKAECAGAENLLKLVRHVADHPEHINLLASNGTALNQLARAQKSGLKLPGVRVWMDRDIAAGRR